MSRIKSPDTGAPTLSSLMILYGVLTSGGDTLTHEEACGVGRDMVKSMITNMRAATVTPPKPKVARKPTKKRHLRLVP